MVTTAQLISSGFFLNIARDGLTTLCACYIAIFMNHLCYLMHLMLTLIDILISRDAKASKTLTLTRHWSTCKRPFSDC